MTMALRDSMLETMCRSLGGLLGRVERWAFAGGTPWSAVEPVEHALGGALLSVSTPDGFRRSLAEQLRLAALSRAHDLSVVRRHAVRPHWLLAATAGLLAATAVAMALASGRRAPARG